MRPNNTRTQRQIADLFVNVLTNGSIERIDSPPPRGRGRRDAGGRAEHAVLSTFSGGGGIVTDDQQGSNQRGVNLA